MHRFQGFNKVIAGNAEWSGFTLESSGFNSSLLGHTAVAQHLFMLPVSKHPVLAASETAKRLVVYASSLQALGDQMVCHA